MAWGAYADGRSSVGGGSGESETVVDLLALVSPGNLLDFENGVGSVGSRKRTLCSNDQRMPPPL